MNKTTNQTKSGESKNPRFTQRQQEFMKSEAASLARIELKLMANDPKYNTQDSFSAKSIEDVPFVDKHMQYLSEHPKLDPRHYISNLKLKTKVRS